MDQALFARLATKYADGFASLDLRDFEGVTTEDRLKLYAEIQGDENPVHRVSCDDLVARAPKKPAALPARSFRYTMSTANPVGFFGDIIEVAGWNLIDFNKRGRPFLFGHNMDENRHPLGDMNGLLKGAKEDEVKGQPVLAGNGRFTEEGLNPFNDLTHDMVQANKMPGGSVGFRILESRGPTEEELAENKKLHKFSFISTKTSLVEFSAVPVGMDPDAVKRRADAMPALDALLARGLQDGRYTEELIARFRHEVMGIAPKAKGRSQVSLSPEVDGTTHTFGRNTLSAEEIEARLAVKFEAERIADIPLEERTEEELQVELEHPGTGVEMQATEANTDGELIAVGTTTGEELSDEDAEALDDLEASLARALLGDEEDGGGEPDTGSQRSASRADNVTATGTSPSPDLADVIRGLDRLGLPVDAAELQRAMAGDQPAEGAVDLAPLIAENAELRAIIEDLQERMAVLEEVLLPESAERGDDDVSLEAGDDGGEGAGMYQYLEDLEVDEGSLVA